MATTTKPAKPAGKKSARLTVDLGSENLYKAIRILAIEQRRTVRDVVIEALRRWVEAQEEKEDLAAYQEAKDEPTVPWEEVEAEIRGLEASEHAQ